MNRGPWGHIDPASVKPNDFTRRIYFDYVTPAIEAKNIKERRVEGLSISYTVLESLGWIPPQEQQRLELPAKTSHTDEPPVFNYEEAE